MNLKVGSELDPYSASLQAGEPYANFKHDSRYALRAQVPAGLNRKEAEIYSRLDPERLPHHIAIIMDGNGRWAKRRHLPRIAGHRAGDWDHGHTCHQYGDEHDVCGWQDQGEWHLLRPAACYQHSYRQGTCR